jgi:hypothetical protein
MTETNTIEKTKYQGRKEGYMQATNGMPGNPVNIAGVNRKWSESSAG